VGGNSDRAIVTAAGVMVGALLGDNIDQNRNSSICYDIVITMQAGSQQAIRV
jgi:outer membrane lipoprotein SlyB